MFYIVLYRSCGQVVECLGLCLVQVGSKVREARLGRDFSQKIEQILLGIQAVDGVCMAVRILNVLAVSYLLLIIFRIVFRINILKRKVKRY